MGWNFRETHTHTHRDTQIAHAKANEIQVRCAPWSTASHQGQSCGFDNWAIPIIRGG